MTYPVIERDDDPWLEEAGRLWDARSNRAILDIVLSAWEPSWQAFLLSNASQRAEALNVVNDVHPPIQLDATPFSLADGIAERKMAMAGIDEMVAASETQSQRLAPEGTDFEQFRPPPERCTRVLTPRLKIRYNGAAGFHPEAFKAAWSRRCAWYDAERTSSAKLGHMAIETLDNLNLETGLVTGGGVSVRVYWRRKEIDWQAARKALESRKDKQRKRRAA